MSVFDETLSRRSFAKAAAAVSTGVVVGHAAFLSGSAQDATPEAGEGGPGLPPLPEGATVVAEGLLNPRFLAIGDDGTLYITENGIGGDEVLTPPENGTGEVEATPEGDANAPEGTPAESPPRPPSTRGYTGQISQVTPDGTQEVLAEGLASYSDGAGPTGIALGTGEIYFSIGGLAVGSGAEPLPEENTINRLVLETGEVEVIAELGPYEEERNPDEEDINPNLYAIAARDGQILVTDAGANTIYGVDVATGEFELLAVVPQLPDLPDVDAAGEDLPPRQAVPTGVAVADDGTAYVGLLSEGWPEGAPSILTLEDDGTFDAAGGPLGFNVGIAVGPDGLVYASQLFSLVEGAQEPGPGSVVRITEDGEVETVVEGLMMPHGITFDADGNLYVAINSLMSGPDMAAGQVIRIDGVATPV